MLFLQASVFGRTIFWNWVFLLSGTLADQNNEGMIRLLGVILRELTNFSRHEVLYVVARYNSTSYSSCSIMVLYEALKQDPRCDHGHYFFNLESCNSQTL